MAEPRLLRRLEAVVGRLRTLRSLWTASLGWAILAVAILCFWATDRPSLAWSAVLFGVPAVMICAAIAGARRGSDRHQAALLVEKTYPELDSRLITAVEQQPSGGAWNFTYLQSELLTQTFAQLKHQDWHRAVASRRILIAHVLHASLLLVCVALLWPMLSALNRSEPSAGILAGESDASGAEWKVSVEPGDVEIERGSSLLVLARFPSRVPTTVELVAVDEDNKEIRTPLTKSLEDPVFGGRLASLQKGLKYHVEFEGEKSERFQVRLFDFPTLVKADATVMAPEFTGIAPKTVENVRKLTVVEGSSVELVCEFNFEIPRAQLVDETAPDRKIELIQNDLGVRIGSVGWRFDEPGEYRYKLKLTDQFGRTNRDPVEFRMTVVPNRAPDLKVTFPSRDLKVSSLQELLLEARASDDFGLKGMGLIYQTPSGEEAVIDFEKEAAADQSAQVEHLLAIESLKLNPDDLISYYFYADDLGPRGEPRRSFSDLFFAEVRPFEEVFRQAPESPASSSSNSQSQSGSESNKLLELQREIVTASWNVLRKEKQDRLSASFQDDVQTLGQSQVEAQKLAQALSGEVSDELMKRYALQAVQNMTEAAEHFQRAFSHRELSHVSPGRLAAQKAYQDLLKLQARESMVTQSQSGQSRQGGSNRQMNQQLDALKLKNDRSRYQSEQQASQEQSESEQAALQVLNRLKDLARRQQDLNERIRELEMAMREAEDEEKRNEIQRQLQRLQEEQEDLLRDLDDVREKMNEDQNRQQMAEAREKAEETRERVVRAGEALKEGQTSKALTEGTRAQRQFQELEEDLRKQAAGQFDERIRQLRDDVRELAHNQQQLAEKLEESPKSPGKQHDSLGDSPATPDSNQDLANDFERQKENLSDLINRARSLVEDSESSEPILSKRLYETLRNLREYQPEESLEAAHRFTRQGNLEHVRTLEEQAREGIHHLQSGIEQAADSILGNEDAALRLARSELSELSESLRRELARNTPESHEAQPGYRNEPSEDDRVGQSSSSPASGDKNDSRADSAQNNNQKADSRKNSEGAPNQQPGQDQSGQDQSGQGQSSPGSPMSGASQAGGPRGEQPNSQSEASGEGEGESNQKSGQLTSERQQKLSESTQRLLGLGAGSGSDPLYEDGPLTGERFTEWSTRLQDVEDLLTTPQLRAQATAIRDRARRERIDVKRHSKAPDWELVRTSIYGPLLELEQQVAEELARRNSEKRLVPIDRDPVPEQYSEFVRSYYEQLSRQPIE